MRSPAISTRQLRSDVDGRLQRAVHWAIVGMKPEHPLRRLALRCFQLQPVDDVDPADDEDVPLLLDVAGGLGAEVALSRRNPARFQRATKGAGQSAGGCCHQVVEGRGVRRVHLGIDPVVRRHLIVNTEVHRLAHGEVRTPPGALKPFDPDLGPVCHRICHRLLRVTAML